MNISIVIPTMSRKTNNFDYLALAETHGGGENMTRFPNDNNNNNSSSSSGSSNSSGESYTVSGAGLDAVNGVYEYAGTHDAVPMYTKRGSGAPLGALTLYRCTLNSGVKRWYISIVQTQTPGTASDIDYYWVGKEVWQGDPSPPPEGWNTCKGTGGDMSGGGLDPPPLVRLEKAAEEIGGVAEDLEQMEL